MSKRVLFLAKKDDYWSLMAFEKTKKLFPECEGYFAEWGDPIPDQVKRWKGDYIFSYLSRWVLPEEVLEKAKGCALNFHPAPPEYPGVGCLNFALYEGTLNYGTTCHLMNSRVDSGPIVKVKRFPVYPHDDVASLLNRTYRNQYELFEEIIDRLLSREVLSTTNEQWSKNKRNRKDLDQLATITPEMSKDEMSKRVRATNFEKFKTKILVNGFLFQYEGKA